MTKILQVKKRKMAIKQETSPEQHNLLMEGEKKKSSLPASGIIHFYYDGFRTLSEWGKQVWIVILIKLFIIFAILKLFFFPDFLKKNYTDDTQRSEYVLDQITKTPDTDD